MVFQKILLVFLGGGLGSVLRYILTKNLNPLFSNIYLGTLSVNLIGSFLIGLLIGFEIKTLIQKPLLLLLVTGFCGGFTTFSAFAFENFSLLKSDQYLEAFIYTFGSIIFGILAVGLGFLISKQF